jgi:hypothetical protein
MHTVTLRTSQYNQKLKEGHVFGHLKVMLVFVEGNLRMHCLCNLYMRKIDSGLV